MLGSGSEHVMPVKVPYFLHRVPLWRTRRRAAHRLDRGKMKSVDNWARRYGYGEMRSGKAEKFFKHLYYYTRHMSGLF